MQVDKMKTKEQARRTDETGDGELDGWNPGNPSVLDLVELIKSDNETPYTAFCCLEATPIQRIILSFELHTDPTFEKRLNLEKAESTQPPRTKPFLIAAPTIVCQRRRSR